MFFVCRLTRAMGMKGEFCRVYCARFNLLDHEKYEVLLSKLERTMETYVELGPLERMRMELSAVRSQLEVFKEMVLADGFADPRSEIQFFKGVKPRFCALIILSAERYGFESMRPLLKGKALERYYGETLNYIDRVFAQHGFLYQYYKMGAEEMETVYFVRRTARLGLVGADVPDLDPALATLWDYLFARFMALERLRELVAAEM